MDLEKRLVLIVEDQAIFHQIYTMFLRRFECDIEFASNGWEALSFLKRRSPSFILLDMDMPDMNGAQFLRYFEKTRLAERVPVFIVSSLRDEQIQEREPGLLDRVQGYLQKPLTMKKLHTVLERQLT